MTDPADLAGRRANLARWDEAAPLHAQSALYDLQGFRAARNDIRPFEHDELGSVAGRELLHLQCHLGTDTLSWARHGARAGVVHDGRTLDLDIFDADFRAWDEKGGTYAAPEAVLQHTTSYERVHAISEVIIAVLDAGLTLELFHEQAYTNVPWPWTERGDDGYYRLPEGWPRFPLTYSLRARRADE